MNTPLVYSIVMVLAGVGIPIMAAMNAGLGTRLQSPALAAVILFSIGLIVAITYLIFVEGLPARLHVPETPWYFYLGGFFVMFYILTITWVAPRFGVANAVAFVLLGQLFAICVIDHFGLFGAMRFELSSQRVAGLVVMGIGVFMVLAKSTDAS